MQRKHSVYSFTHLKIRKNTLTLEFHLFSCNPESIFILEQYMAWMTYAVHCMLSPAFTINI